MSWDRASTSVLLVAAFEQLCHDASPEAERFGLQTGLRGCPGWAMLFRAEAGKRSQRITKSSSGRQPELSRNVEEIETIDAFGHGVAVPPLNSLLN